ncbi:hypothetical protein [Photorhabdus hindustanensis]|uniref:hypothetical protein n=1 Tax=Photorhabdus hindustanensis TaxID=2918802 RepID=UPI0015E45D44|nr:hypothetical protein [Photorhabdus hindustanensis]
MGVVGKNNRLNLPNFLADCDDSNYIIDLNIDNYCGRIWGYHVVGWSGVLVV